ncbi:MAG: UDP-N-acetylmuramate--L-alanine ligase [Candidatus Nealsonbacteria bacterium]
MNIHFIGIGGIGVSALAQYYLSFGHKVSGSDLVSSEITESLKEKGVKVFISQQKFGGFEDIDLVVYSPAVKEDNLELKEAKNLRIKCQSYPEALGELTKKYFTIAVSGTHGKSTTTSMIGILLEKAGFDPTVILGTKLKEFGNSNCRVGKSKYLIIEADEHFASFLNYWPKIIILTNIEKDHLDYYKSLENILGSFKKYIEKLPEEGILIANADDENILNILKSKPKLNNVKFYSLKQEEVKNLKLKVPGDHNKLNALAVLSLGRVLGIDDEKIFLALSEYKGSWRRFEEQEVGGLKIISDYAHHPTEVRATLKAAREKWPKKEIWCVFQPHQYQRTYYLFDDFVKVLKSHPISKVIVTDIYDVPGRESEKISSKVSSKELVKAADNQKVIYLKKEEVIPCIKKEMKKDGVVIIMGAGDIYKLVQDFSVDNS